MQLAEERRMILSSVHSTGHASARETVPPTLPATVLVVDGSEANRDHMAALLRICGYRAVVAPHVLAAVALLAKIRPVLIVCDLRLLMADTGSLLAYCRSEFHDVPILMLGNEVPDAPPNIETGMAGFLLNPIDPGKFCAAVCRVIARAAMRTAGARHRPGRPL
jgi:CheY-like chemotaxis protein